MRFFQKDHFKGEKDKKKEGAPDSLPCNLAHLDDFRDLRCF